MGQTNTQISQGRKHLTDPVNWRRWPTIKKNYAKAKIWAPASSLPLRIKNAFPGLLPMKPHWNTARSVRIRVWVTLWVMLTSPPIKERKGLKSQRWLTRLLRGRGASVFSHSFPRVPQKIALLTSPHATLPMACRCREREGPHHKLWEKSNTCRQAGKHKKMVKRSHNPMCNITLPQGMVW